MVLLAAFVVAERRSSHPLLPLHVILDRTRGGSYVAVGISGIAIFGVFLFLTYYLQEVKGYSPVTSGLAFLPMIGCILLSSNVSSIVTLPRLGPRVLITTGMLLGAGAMTYLTQLTVTSSYAGGVLPALLIMGLGFGMIFSPAINTATAGVQRQDSAWPPRWSTPCSRSADRSGRRAEHHRADRDGQLPRRAPHGAAGAGDRGHPRLHHGLCSVRGNLRSRRDPRDRPAAIPAAAGRTQGRRGRGRSCATRRRARARRRAAAAARRAPPRRTPLPPPPTSAPRAAARDARDSRDSGSPGLLLAGDKTRFAPGGQARRVIAAGWRYGHADGARWHWHVILVRGPATC